MGINSIGIANVCASKDLGVKFVRKKFMDIQIFVIMFVRMEVIKLKNIKLMVANVNVKNSTMVCYVNIKKLVIIIVRMVVIH